MKFSGRFGDEDNADIQAGEFRRGSPFEERDEVHALVIAGAGFLTGRNQFFGKIHNKSDSLPFLLFLSDEQKKATKQGRELYEIARWAGLMKIRVLDIVVNLEPFEKALLHFAGAESETVADVVKQEAGAIWKESLHKK